MKKNTLTAFICISFLLHAALVVLLVLVPLPRSSQHGGAVMEVTLVSPAGGQPQALSSGHVRPPSPGRHAPARTLEPGRPAEGERSAADASPAQAAAAGDSAMPAGQGMAEGQARGGSASGGQASAIETQGSGGASLARYNSLIVEIISRNRFYPDSARRRGIEGSVDVRLTIDRTGRPSDVRVVKTSGAGILDRASVQTIRGCSFPPPPSDSVTLPITITYRLMEGEQS